MKIKVGRVTVNLEIAPRNQHLWLHGWRMKDETEPMIRKVVI